MSSRSSADTHEINPSSPGGHPKPASFAGDVVKLVSGTTIAQALSVLSAPITSRLYSPDSFGITALLASIISLLNVVICLRYEMALMLPDSDHEAANILGLCAVSSFGISGLCAIVILLARDGIVSLLGEPLLARYIWLVPLIVLLNGLALGCQYWFSRLGQFGRISSRTVTASSLAYGFKIVAGFLFRGPQWGLVGSIVVASLGGLAGLLIGAFRPTASFLREHVSRTGIVRVAKAYREYPLLNMWSALSNTFSAQLPILMLSFFFAANVVGYYQQAHTMLTLPLTLVGGAIGQVFFQRASKVKQVGGSLSGLTANSLENLLSIGVVPFAILAAAGRSLIPILLGGAWVETGVYVQILSPWLLLVFLYSPLSTLFLVLDRQKEFLITSLVLVVVRAIALAVGGWIGNPRIALALYSAISTLGWLAMLVYILRLAAVSLRETLLHSRHAIVWSIFIVSTVLIVQQVWPQPLGIAALIAVEMAAYYVFLAKKSPALARLVLGGKRRDAKEV